MADAKNLESVLSDAVFNHPDCFDSRRYALWERSVATPVLEAAGFSVGAWWSGDQDSFGPLVRCVSLTKSGKTHTYFYG